MNGNHIYRVGEVKMSRTRKRTRTVEDVDTTQNFDKIQPLNQEQAEYMQLIAKNYITVCTGKAGSGKTAVASGMAVQYLLNKRIRKIILTRPAVGAEDLGYLPGDGVKKIHPYLMPLFEELGNFCDVNALMKQNKITILPLAYMRGCNIKDSIIIADECQNASFKLLQLLLTRLSENSKIIMTGDVKQSDLTYHQCDFSRVIEKVLKPLSEYEENRIGIINLNNSVRHWLVERIADRFEEIEN